VDSLKEMVLMPAPLYRDGEVLRWYADGGEACLALSRRGKLLEPLPTFGPSCYRLIATRVQREEAHDYALGHGYCHLRLLPQWGGS
jgi:hypothetical protein